MTSIRNSIIYIFFLLSFCFSQEFGKNIVQYDDFDWSYIQTKHFDIYYYGEGRKQADFVAHFAEEGYEKIKLLLGWGLNNRSDIILYNSHNDFQQTNVVPIYMEEGIGGVTELMKNRMVIPYDGSLSEFKHVIYHELVHVFINDGIYGGSIMNMLKNSNIFIPLWMNEGLAEYCADDWNTNSDMWLRDIAINYSQLPDISQLNGYLAYRGGQSVWSFITEKWGEEVISEIFKQVKYKRDVNKGIEEALGINIKTLSEQWHIYLKQKYWPDIEKRENIQDIAFQLTNHIDMYNNYNIAPSISPDKNKIAIYSNKEGLMSIYIISPSDGKFLDKIISGQITSEYEELHVLKPGISWSPSSKQLVFAVKSGDSDALVIHDINNPKKRFKKKFEIEGIYRPVWNPQNNKIAFIGYQNFSSDVFVYNLDNDELTQLTNDTYSDIQISWSPDGKELLLVSDRGNNIAKKSHTDIISIIGSDFDNNDIYTLDLNGQLERLTNTSYNESYPTYDLDGNAIAYISDESGINNIYITTDRFESSKNLTNVITGITQLEWYDNNQIIFTGFYNSGYDIFRIANIKEKLENSESIKDAKWRSKTKYNYLKNNDSNHYSKNDLSSYRFIQNDKGNNFSIDTDTTNSEISYKYKTRFTLDYAATKFAYRVLENKAQGLGYFLFSDILGDHKIRLESSLVIDFKQFDFLFHYINLKNRINWSTLLSNYNYTGPIYNNYHEQNPDYYYEYYDLIRDIAFGMTFKNPFSKFSRIEGGFNFKYLQKYQERLATFSGIEYSIFQESYNISTYHIKYVWDNTRYLSGNRMFIKYEISPKISYNDFYYKKLSIDYRNYLKLSYKGQILLASRVFYGTSTGRDARIFGIGGAGYDTFFHGDNALLNPTYANSIMEDSEYQYYSMNDFQFPIRGYNIAQKYGKNSMIMNLELRLPFLLYYFPAIKYLGQIYGVLFIDAGVTWDNRFPSFSNQNNWNQLSNEGWIMSCGIGPRFYLFGMPWKLDYAWQYNPYEGIISDRKWYLSVGYDF